MAMREKLSQGYSEEAFTRGAMRVHPKNFLFQTHMRGGIRL